MQLSLGERARIQRAGVVGGRAKGAGDLVQRQVEALELRRRVARLAVLGRERERSGGGGECRGEPERGLHLGRRQREVGWSELCNAQRMKLEVE